MRTLPSSIVKSPAIVFVQFLTISKFRAPIEPEASSKNTRSIFKGGHAVKDDVVFLNLRKDWWGMS